MTFAGGGRESGAISNKSYGAAVSLCIVFGVVGIHHFYIGNWLHGLFDLTLFVVGFGLVYFGQSTGEIVIGGLIILVDVAHTAVVAVSLFGGRTRDGQGRLIPYPGQRIDN